MKPIETRVAKLEAALAPASAPLVIRRVIVDRMPDGTLVETPYTEITVGNVRVTLPDNGRDELPPD